MHRRRTGPRALRRANLGLLACALACAPGSPADDPAGDTDPGSGGPADAGTSDGSGDDPTGGPGEGVTLVDVAVLFPLSQDADDTMLAPSSAGARGELLPLSVFEQLPPLLSNGAGLAIYDNLRVVSARFDPCAQDEPGSACAPQLRLVLQFFISADEGVEDMAVHTTYRLTEAEFQDVVEAILALKAEGPAIDPAAPLDVHPVMQTQGLAGPAAEAYKVLILAHAGADNLARVTFMTLVNGRNWEFGGFDVADGAIQPMIIPSSTDTTLQIVSAMDGTSYQPLLPEDEALAPFLDPAEAASAPDEVVAAAVAQALAIENPTLGTPETLTCVGCHLATQVRHAAETERGVDTAGHPNRFTSTFNLSLERSESLEMTTADRFLPLRGFGYNGRVVHFTQRVVNDSAASAAHINAEYLGAP